MAPSFDAASPSPIVLSPRKHSFFFSNHQRRSSQQTNGTARPQQQSPVRARHQRGSSSEGSWDMGEDYGSEPGMDLDVSRGEYDEVDDEGAYIEVYKQEMVDFAYELDLTKVVPGADGQLVAEAGTGFDVIGRFERLAEEKVKDLRARVEALEEEGAGEEDRAIWDRELHYWEMEHQTWDLFGRLADLRLKDPTQVEQVPEALAKNRFISDERIRRFLYTAHPKFREFSNILEWVQVYFPDPSPEYLDADGQYKGTSGWIYTKEKIKSSKRMKLDGRRLLPSDTFSRSKRNTVTELDPDAPTRQQLALEEEDEASERFLMKMIWMFVRKGDIESAQELCDEVGEWWRGASLMGGEEAWDEDLDGSEDTEMNGDNEHVRVRGNRRRELWKRMCYAIARRKDGETYERAVYGALCGDIDSVIPVCSSWEDFLFAHVNSLVEAYYSWVLNGLGRIPPSVSQFPAFDSVAYHSRGTTLLDDDTIMHRIVDSINRVPDLDDVKQPLRMVQGALISLRLDQLVAELARQHRLCLEDPTYNPEDDPGTQNLDITEPRLLRVVSHVLLVLQAVGAGSPAGSPEHAAAETVIGAYIQFLAAGRKYDTIPMYASRLSKEKAVGVIGDILMEIQGDDREEILRLMHMYNVDAESCLRHATQKLLDTTAEFYTPSAVPPGTATEGFLVDVERSDEQLINALEWLVIAGPDLRAGLIKSVCEVYIRFLLTGRLAAAQRLHDSIQSKDIIPAEPDNILGDADDNLADDPLFADRQVRIAAAIFMQLETVVGALIHLQEFKTVAANRPPRIDRAYRESLKTAYSDARMRLSDIIQDTFLNFPVAVTAHTFPRLPEIRIFYVPEVVLALHHLHIEAGTFIDKRYLANALELTTTVADADRAVLATFMESGRLAEYVDEVAKASRGMLGVVQESGGKAPQELTIWCVKK